MLCLIRFRPSTRPFSSQTQLDAETRSVQRIAGRNFKHRRHLPLGRAQLFVGTVPELSASHSQRLRFPFRRVRRILNHKRSRACAIRRNENQRASPSRKKRNKGVLLPPTKGRCDSVIDLRVNSGTVQSNSCGSLKASGVDVRSSVHAEHEREQVSMPSSCEIRTVGLTRGREMAPRP